MVGGGCLQMKQKANQMRGTGPTGRREGTSGHHQRAGDDQLR